MLVAFSVAPLGVGEAVAECVADAVRVVRDSGLPNRTDAMFTTVEGDWDEVMDVVKRAVEAVAAKAPRVSLTLKADVRPGVPGRWSPRSGDAGLRDPPVARPVTPARLQVAPPCLDDHVVADVGVEVMVQAEADNAVVVRVTRPARRFA